MIHVKKPNSGPSNGGRESPGVFGNVCAARQHMQEHWPRHLCRRFKEVSVGEAWYTLSILWDFFHPFLSDTTLVGFSDTARQHGRPRPEPGITRTYDTHTLPPARHAALKPAPARPRPPDPPDLQAKPRKHRASAFPCRRPHAAAARCGRPPESGVCLTGKRMPG